MSQSARLARISSLENMVAVSSNTLVAMAAQLSEAEERDRAFTGRGRWNQLRSLGDAKCLLQYMFNVAADSRFEVLIFNPNIMILGFFSTYKTSLQTLLFGGVTNRSEIIIH